MFPEKLDGADVLFHACENGALYFKGTNDIAARYSYLAIAKYESSNGYYLFKCDDDYEVVSDSLWDSIDECMTAAQGSSGNKIAWIDSKVIEK